MSCSTLFMCCITLTFKCLPFLKYKKKTMFFNAREDLPLKLNHNITRGRHMKEMSPCYLYVYSCAYLNSLYMKFAVWPSQKVDILTPLFLRPGKNVFLSSQYYQRQLFFPSGMDRFVELEKKSGFLLYLWNKSWPPSMG